VLVALGDQIVQVLVGRRPQRFQAEVIDDQQSDPSQRGEFAFVGAGGARGVERLGQARAGCGVILTTAE
jgi:hypothetical protein